MVFHSNMWYNKYIFDGFFVSVAPLNSSRCSKETLKDMLPEVGDLQRSSDVAEPSLMSHRPAAKITQFIDRNVVCSVSVCGNTTAFHSPHMKDRSVFLGACPRPLHTNR